jgi:hypothetical protein
MTFADRIRQGIPAVGLNQAAVARQLDISPQRFQKIIDGQGRSKYLSRIAAILKTSSEWLVTGNGPAPTWAAQPSEESPENSGIIEQLARDMQRASTYVTELERTNADLARRLEEAERQLAAERKGTRVQ